MLWDCPRSSSHTALLTPSGLNWQNWFSQMTSTAVSAGMLPLQTIQRSQTGFLLTGSTSHRCLLRWYSGSNGLLVLIWVAAPWKCWPLKMTLAHSCSWRHHQLCRWCGQYHEYSHCHGWKQSWNCSITKTKPQHSCNKPYSEVEDFSMDLVDLIATCQRHTQCSAAYCLRKKKGKQECRFGYPKPLQQVTTITTENGDPSFITARNHCLLNSYNPVQLSGWRTNVDMQSVVSRRRVINYVAKYATKSEPRSKSLKTV